MFGDMMGKLREAQEKLEKSKEKLDAINVEGRAKGVFVEATASKKIKNISIDDDAMNLEKEALEQAIAEAVNNAMDEATKLAEAEMQDTAKGILPNIPGLF